MEFLYKNIFKNLDLKRKKDYVTIKKLEMLAAIFGAVVTALIWGVTDPLMKKFGSDPKSIDNWLTRLIPFLSNWRFALTFAVNQIGSVTFLWTLNKSYLSFAVPVTNSLKFLFTFITGQFLGEGKLTQKSTIGVLCIFLGVILQIYDNVKK